jgi:hypothetical protein
LDWSLLDLQHGLQPSSFLPGEGGKVPCMEQILAHSRFILLPELAEEFSGVIGI